MVLQLSQFIVFFLFINIFLTGAAIAKTCFVVASYHKGHEGNDTILGAIQSKVKGHCDLNVFYLDSKRNTDREFIRKKGLEAKALIEKSRPDVVIYSDDNAVSDVLVPHFKDSNIPMIFCGINWSIDRYQLPFQHTTGMIEVDPTQAIISELLSFQKDLKKVTRIGPKNETEAITVKHTKKVFSASGIEFTGISVENFEDWKKAYLKAQEGSDAIFLASYQGVKGFDHAEAETFVEKNMKKLTLAGGATMLKFGVFAITKRMAEHGEFSGDAAVKILKGTSPKDISVTTNKTFDSYINDKYKSKFNIKYSSGFTSRLSKNVPSLGSQ